MRKRKQADQGQERILKFVEAGVHINTNLGGHVVFSNCSPTTESRTQHWKKDSPRVKDSLGRWDEHAKEWKELRTLQL